VRKTDHTAFYTAKVGSIQQQVVRKTDHTALYTAKVGSIQQQVVRKTERHSLGDTVLSLSECRSVPAIQSL